MNRNKMIRALVALTVTLASCSNGNDGADAYGNFETNEVMVSAQASGQINSLNVREGLTLTSGEVVGCIDTSALHLKKEQLYAMMQGSQSRNPNISAQIEVLKQQKQVQEKEKTRISNLVKSGAATQKNLDDITGAIDVIDKQIESLQTQFSPVTSDLKSLQVQVEQANGMIQKSLIVSPISGVVLDKYSEQGEVTAAGKPIFKIAPLDTMVLRVYVSGAQLPQIKLGQKVTVLIDKDAKENAELSGIISWISPNAEFTPKIIQTKEERVNLVYAVKVLVKNDGSLKIGMPGEIKFSDK